MNARLLIIDGTPLLLLFLIFGTTHDISEKSNFIVFKPFHNELGVQQARAIRLNPKLRQLRHYLIQFHSTSGP